MKKISYLCMFLLCSSTFLSAQIQKNAKTLEFDLGGQSYQKVHGYELSGRYETAVSQRLMLGLKWDGGLFTGMKLPPDVENGVSYSALAGPSARYFLTSSDSRLQWFVNGRAAWGINRQFDRIDNQWQPQQYFTQVLEVGGGASWFLQPGLALEGQFGYYSRDIQGYNSQHKLFLDFRLRPYFYKGQSDQLLDTDNSWWVNGQLQWGHPLDMYYDHNELNIALEALHFLSPKWALAGRIDYADQYMYRANFQVQGRYYLNPRQKLQVFLQTTLGAGLTELHEVSLNVDVVVFDPNVQLGGGLTYFINDRMALDLSLGRSWSTDFQKRGPAGQASLKFLLGKK